MTTAHFDPHRVAVSVVARNPELRSELSPVCYVTCSRCGAQVAFAARALAAGIRALLHAGWTGTGERTLCGACSRAAGPIDLGGPRIVGPTGRHARDLRGMRPEDRMRPANRRGP